MDAQLPRLDERDVVFVSHANPEDNAFATWLALRLTREGYRTWCDVVRLKGGHDFWANIETAIRKHVRKFVFVVSNVSNQKPGVLKELSVAQGVAQQLKDESFVIPVKIDDLPYSDHNIQINRLNALSFQTGWASGYAQLLDTLAEAGVPKTEASGPSLVASWWNSTQLNHKMLSRKPDTLWTNWFPVKNLPTRLWVWHIPDGQTLPDDFPYPTYRKADKLFSFADAEALMVDGGTPSGGTGMSFSINRGKDPPAKSNLTSKDVNTAVKQLLINSWLAMAEQRRLPLYQLSSWRKSLWFPKDFVPNDTVKFQGINGKSVRKDLCGYKTIRKINGDTFKRYWHYGLEAVPILYPKPVLALKHHVFFTHDGKTIAGDAKFQHRARRSQCKLWWNDKWRDLMLASATCLADHTLTLPLPLCPECNTEMESHPQTYRSRVSYDDAQVRVNNMETTCDTFDDETEETELAET